MTERPILFRGPMVRAILAGKKTQTRRVVDVRASGDLVTLRGKTFDPRYTHHVAAMIGLGPYGQPGDRLWVRETWRAQERSNGLDGIRFAADGCFVTIANTSLAAERWVVAYDNGRHGESWRPPIFMPRWASRLTLTVEAVRVERLHAITEEDALAEGVDTAVPIPARINGRRGTVQAFGENAAKASFAMLWDGLNGKRAPWRSNPWVWVVTFSRVCCCGTTTPCPVHPRGRPSCRHGYLPCDFGCSA